MRIKKSLKKYISLLLTVLMMVGMFPTSFTAYALGEENHSHTAECYAAEGDLLCQLSESEGHTHTDECRCPGGELICGSEETEGHAHNEACYIDSGEPVCGKKETEAHSHEAGCYCPGGELVCSLEESEGHTHSEDCYAKGGELICGLEETEPVNLLLGASNGLEWHGEVMTAQDLKNAVSYPAEGESIVLGADITYSQSELGTISVSKNVVLDFNGHKITVDDALFEITETGSLTIRNAEIETTDDDFIDYNYGSFTVESTGGSGIHTDDDFISENYGIVLIKSGTFTLGYSLVYENYGSGSIVIEDADLTADDYVVGYNENADCTITINGGSFTTECRAIYIEDGTVIINGGDFEITEEDEYGFYVDGGQLIFKDGSVTSTSNAIYAYEGSATLYGGTFTSAGDAALFAEPDATITIADGYKADPADWETTAASSVTVSPLEYDIVFVDADGNELYRETIKHAQPVSNWPETPDAPDEGYRWWGWVDSEGNRYTADSVFTKDTTLQAKFVNEGLPIDPDPDTPDTPTDPEYPEKPTSEATVVTTYTELKDAIEKGETNILISGEITFPNGGTLTIKSDTYITGENGSSINGSGDMFRLNDDVTLTVESLNAECKSGRVFLLNSSNATLNVISGSYTAPDDVIYGGKVNLYGGTITEKTGRDGPIYGSNVTFMNNTKNISDDSHVTEVGAKSIYTVVLYDGASVYKTIETYEDTIVTLPKIDSDVFLGWYDATGRKYENSVFVTDDLDLYAKYSTDTVTITFVVDGENHISEIGFGEALSAADGFDLAEIWKDADGNIWLGESIPEADITLYPNTDYEEVTTLEELKAALAGSNNTIIVADAIPVTETVVVSRDVTILAKNGGSLIRPDGFEDALLSVESADLQLGEILIDGCGIEANAPAVKVDKESTLTLNGTTIQNNINNSAWSNGGGAIGTLGKVYMYDGTTLCSNKSQHGGGVYVDCDNDTVACFYLYGGDICHNQAWSNDHTGAGGGVKVDTAYDTDYVAFYMYGGRIHHNKAYDPDYSSLSCDGGGVALSCGDDGIHFVMYGGEITDNYASGEGGAVYTACSSFAMYDGLLARNVAAESGGAVATCCCDNTFYMYGGTITLNAAVKGGGVDCTGGAPYTLYGNVYGNVASETGDDVYANTRKDYGAILRDENDPILLENPYYIEDEMQDLFKEITESRPDYIACKPVDGYDIDLSSITVVHLGWFVDADNREFEDQRYIAGDFLVTAKKASAVLEEYQDVKAIYGGYFLVYDANHDNGEYQYDSTTYVPDATAKTAGNMFDYPGYTFVGWNTKPDGSGLWYYPDLNGYNRLTMDSSKVVYAQWKKIPLGNLEVSKTVSGDGASTTKAFTFTATLNDASISGTYGDMEFKNGVATFTLKDGESKTTTGLPAGTGYTVSESDNSGYTVTVNNTDEAVATGAIVAGETVIAAFNNYKSGGGGGGSDPDPAKVTITAEKTLNGQAPVGSDYSFVLKDESGNVVQTVQNNGGSIAFNALSFSKTGTFNYTISEVPGNDSTINYDTAVYKIIFEVTRSGDYKATVSYEKDGAAYTGTPVFANTTKPVDPDNPDKPDNPDQPSDPTDPVTPTDPTDPSNPDTPDNPDTPVTPDKPTRPVEDVPQTGDNSHIGLWVALACLSLLGMIATMFRRKRYSESRSE